MTDDPDTEGSAAAFVTAEDLHDFAPEWATVHGRIPAAIPFSHPAWYRTWLAHFPIASPVILSVRLGEQLVGVIPLAMEPGRAQGLGNPKIQDYCGILCAPGQEDALADGLLHWLWEDMTHSLEVWGLQESSALRRALLAAADRLGWQAQEQHEGVAPVADLPGDWEAFVASLGKHDRHELRRKLRNLEAAGAVQLTATGSPGEVSAAMDILFGMMRTSHEGKARFLTAEMEAFFASMAPAMAEAGLARFWTLRLDGKPVAVLLGFESATTAFLYNSGFDPDFQGLAVGLLSKALAIRQAIEGGRTAFDFMRGDEDYKRRLGGVPRQVVRLVIAQG